jgi:hypothetical protein
VLYKIQFPELSSLVNQRLPKRSIGILHFQCERLFVFLSRQVQCRNIVQIDNRHDRWPMQLALTGLSQQNTFRTRHSRSILCGDVQRQRGWRSLAAPLSVETPWMWAQYHCDLQRSKGVRLIINDDYTHKYIIHVLNQFDQDIHSRQRQTDEQFTYSNCFHRSYSQQVREKESNSHESIQESA